MSFETGPYLILAAFCEQVLEDKSGVLSLIRIVDRLYVSTSSPTAPEQMPKTMLNWTLVLSFKSGKARGSIPIKIEPELPSGIRVPSFTLTPHFEGENRGVNIMTRMNMKLEAPGIYWFRVFVNNIFYTQIPLEVIYSRTVTPTPPQQ